MCVTGSSASVTTPEVKDQSATPPYLSELRLYLEDRFGGWGRERSRKERIDPDFVGSGDAALPMPMLSVIDNTEDSDTQVKLILGGEGYPVWVLLSYLLTYTDSEDAVAAPHQDNKRWPPSLISQPIIARSADRAVASLSPSTLIPTAVRDRQLRGELRHGAGPGGHGLGGVDSEVVGHRPGAGWRGRPGQVVPSLGGRSTLSRPIDDFD